MNPSVPLQIATTTGDPAGVGPELTAQALAAAAAHWPDAQFVVLGDAALLAERAKAMGVNWTSLTGDRIRLQHVPLGAPSQAGRLDAANGRYVLTLLDNAVDGAV